MTTNELQDVIDGGSVSNTAVEVIEVLKMFEHDRKYSVWIGGSTLSSFSTFQQLWIFKHHGVCCRRSQVLHAEVMLSDSVAMLQEIGERVPNERDVSHAEDCFVRIEVSLGAKLAQAEGECWVARRLDTVTLLHIAFLCHRVGVRT